MCGIYLSGAAKLDNDVQGCALHLEGRICCIEPSLDAQTHCIEALLDYAWS